MAARSAAGEASLKLLAWNVNHRGRAKFMSARMVGALAALSPDLIILTEYVPHETHGAFTAALGDMGLVHSRLSQDVPKENRVLIASRFPLAEGTICAPPIAPSVPSNALHVVVPDVGIEVLGLRIPDYSKQPAIRRACWDWLLATAKAAADRPLVIAGDLNTDPKYSRARCGDRIGQLVNAGFTHAMGEGASYWTPSGVGVQIDHGFASKGLTVLASRYVTEVGEHVLLRRPGALSDHAALWLEFQSGSREVG